MPDLCRCQHGAGLYSTQPEGRSLLLVPPNVLYNWQDEVGLGLAARVLLCTVGTSAHLADIILSPTSSWLPSLLPWWLANQPGCYACAAYSWMPLLFPAALLCHAWAPCPLQFMIWLPSEPRTRAGEQAPAQRRHLTMRQVIVYETEKDVDRWQETPGGALIMTQERFASLALQLKARGRPRKAAGGGLEAGLAAEAAAVRAAALAKALTEGPHLVVVDEGHVIKEPKNQFPQALSRIATQRRLVLTGYPLQNNLLELYAMVAWCDLDVLGDRKEFQGEFVLPVQRGQMPGASREEQREMAAQLSVLHGLTERCVCICCLVVVWRLVVV